MNDRPIAPDDLEALLALAHRAADAAARITLGAFRQPLRIDDKARSGRSFDPVTEADREAELAIHDVLREGSPDIGFIGEESSGPDAVLGARSPAWVVDPIDGTRAFIAGIPLWGTLIGLRVEGAVPIGLLDQPALGERFVASPAGAFSIRAGTAVALRCRGVTALDRATLCCTTPDMFRDAAQRDAFGRLTARVRGVRYGTDCYGYAMLAAGHVDLVVEADLAPWDVQALIPIVRAAGGTISDWDGGDPGLGGAIVAAASPALHEAALGLLRAPG